MSRSNKSKIAVTLLSALAFGANAQAQDLDKSKVVKTDSFSTIKDSKIGDKSGQTLGAVGGTSSRGNQSKGFTKGQKVGIGAAVLLAVVSVTGFTIWGTKSKNKKEDENNTPGKKNKDEKEAGQENKNKKEINLPEQENKKKNVLNIKENKTINKPEIKDDDEIVEHNGKLLKEKFECNIGGFLLVCRAIRDEKQFPTNYKSIQEVFRMKKKFDEIEVYKIDGYNLAFSFRIEKENNYYTVSALLSPDESKTTFSIKLGVNDEGGEIIYEYDP